MDSDSAEQPSPGIRGLCAGFQAGTVAVLVMLAWLAVSAKWYYHTFWTAPNIMASTFYGDRVVRAGFYNTTLSGLALYLIAYTLLGMLFGLVLVEYQNRFRILLFGVVMAMGWYFLWWGLLWKHINPLVPLYTHDRPMVVAHVLYGLWVGRFPRYLESFRTPEAATEAPVPAEVVRSEEAEQ